MIDIEKFRVHILGDGSAGQRHKRILNELYPKTQVTISGKRGPILSDVDNCNAVIIASPPETHAEYLQRYKAKHILCEGPVTWLPDHSNHTRVHQVASNWRFHPDLVELSESQITPPAIAHFWFDYSLRKWRPDSDYRQTCYYESGIDMINLHEIDMALWLCGKCFEASKYSRNYGISKETDACTYMIVHATGCLTTINSSWIGNCYSRGMQLIYPNGDPYEFSWQSPADDIIINTTYRDQLIHWINCIQDDLIPRVTLEDGYNAYLVAKGGQKDDSD